MAKHSPPSIVGVDENLPVTERHDVYPFIDPNQYFTLQAFKGQVVLVTGASRGIGQAVALHYASAGASLVLVSRKQETLDEAKAAVLKEVPGAEVVTFVADVKDPVKAEEAVRVATSRFGRLDVVIANAGTTAPVDKPLAAKDANEWWNAMEVNVRGVYNYLRAAIPAVLEAKGSIIVITSVLGHLRIPFMSDYGSSKFLLGRLVEFAALEYPELRIFALHPGVVRTTLSQESFGADGTNWTFDPASLPAGTMLTISAGKADWLRGRYWSSNWDLNEGEISWKEKTLEQNGLVNKLFIPA
ncbi:NAD-P-binding protein [Lactifluus subvellereus]|nr:NAD-P-binding protein [Lactifluus subvellereus]